MGLKIDAFYFMKESMHFWEQFFNFGANILKFCVANVILEIKALDFSPQFPNNAAHILAARYGESSAPSGV